MTDVVVTTRSGAVRGTSEGGVAVFRGVPFAAAPVDELRFLPPRPIEPWSGVLDCTSAASICPQVQMATSGPLAPIFVNDEPTGEDCLRLNVWTPAADDARRPVMVWIHGGAFTGGSGSNPSFDGSSFAGDGVVYVSINYR